MRPRANVFHARTMELFRTLGVADAIAQAGRPLTGVVAARTLFDRDFVWVERFDNAQGSLSPEIAVQCDAHIVEQILIDKCRETAVEMMFDTEVVALSRRDGRIETVLRNSRGTQETILAERIIGADGASSTVLSSFGMCPTPPVVLSNHVNMVFRAPIPEPPFGLGVQSTFIKTPSGICVLKPTNMQHRWVAGVVCNPDSDDLAQYTTERCARLVREATGLPDLGLELVGVHRWRAQLRITDKWSVEGVFVLGDAAHLMPPGVRWRPTWQSMTPTTSPGNWRLSWPAGRLLDSSTPTKPSGDPWPSQRPIKP